MKFPTLSRVASRALALALSFGALSGQLSAAMADFAGSYEAKLITFVGNPSVETVYGRLELTVTADAKVPASGKASGKLYKTNGKIFPFSVPITQGVGSSSATTANFGVDPIKGLKGVFNTTIRLTLTAAGKVEVSGIEPTLQFMQDGSFKFATFTGKPGSVPEWLGNYTMALINPAPSGATVPAGAGYATLTVLKNGQLSYKGKTGDGAIITGTAKPTADGTYSLYTVPKAYQAGGFLSAAINLSDAKLGLQVEPAVWTKVAKSTDKSYPAGFSTVVDAVVREWLVPAKGAFPLVSSLGFGSSKNFAVTFSGEGLGDGSYTTTLPDTLRITGLSVIQAVSGGVGSPAENNSKVWNTLWDVKLNAFDGSFTGTQVLTHLVGAKTVTRKVLVDGVLVLGNTLGATPFAYGQYRVTPKATGSTEVSGLVKFVGPLEDNKAIQAAGTYKIKLEKGDQVLPPPDKIPADGEIVTVVISDDFQFITVKSSKDKSPRTLPVQGTGSGFITIRAYWDFAKRPKDSLSASLTFGADGKLGIVSLTYFGNYGSQVSVFTASDDGNDGIIVKQP